MTKPLFLARLCGTQEEMGAQHGKLVAEDAARLLEFYRTMPERTLAGDMSGVGGTIGRAVIRGLANAWQSRLARERPAELLGRARAFAGPRVCCSSTIRSAAAWCSGRRARA